MNLLGWRTAAYAAFALGLSGVAILVSTGGSSASAHQSFYGAAAQILPILLLAHIVRLASIRNLIFAGREQRRDHVRAGQQLANRVATLRADVRRAKDADPDLIQDLDQVYQELTTDLESLNRDAEKTDRADRKFAEIIAGNLFVTLIVVPAGLAATLVDLATGSDSAVIYTATILALSWAGLGLLLFEIVVFIAPPSLTSRHGALPEGSG